MSTTPERTVDSEPFDPRSREYLQDPHAHLKSLRDHGPCWVDPSSGQWFLLGYEEVGAGLTRITRGHDDGSDRHVHFPENPFSFDGPGHTAPRGLLSATFASRALSKFRERAQQIVDEVLLGKERGATGRPTPRGDAADSRESIGPGLFLIVLSLLGVSFWR